MFARLFKWVSSRILSSQPVAVTIRVETPTKMRRVLIGKDEFRFNDTNIGVLNIQPGTYSLFWVVYGGEGQHYSLEITAPDSAAWKSGDQRIAGNHDVGVHYPVLVN